MTEVKSPLLNDLRMAAMSIDTFTKKRNNTIKYLFENRQSHKITVDTIAEAAGISRKHVYTIAKEGKDAEL
jgi:predicted transcriptional regulator